MSGLAASTVENWFHPLGGTVLSAQGNFVHYVWEFTLCELVFCIYIKLTTGAGSSVQ